jgi:hypothetical protein
MAHRSSAAALHAARVLLRDYDLSVRPPESLPSGRIPQLKATEAHISVVIDLATNAFRVAELRPELSYWHERIALGTAEAPQIAGFIQRMLDAFGGVPQDLPSDKKFTAVATAPPEFQFNRPQVVMLSKAAREAARCLFHYYEMRPKKHQANQEIDRPMVAKLMESSLGLTRAGESIPLLRRCHAALKAGKATVEDVGRCFRQVGVFLEYMSRYEEREEETKLLT